MKKRNKLLPVLGMKKNNAYITKGTYGMLTYILGISYGMYSGLVIPVLHVDSVKQFQLFTLTYIISLYPGVIWQACIVFQKKPLLLPWQASPLSLLKIPALVHTFANLDIWDPHPLVISNNLEMCMDIFWLAFYLWGREGVEIFRFSSYYRNPKIGFDLCWQTTTLYTYHYMYMHILG